MNGRIFSKRYLSTYQSCLLHSNYVLNQWMPKVNPKLRMVKKLFCYGNKLLGDAKTWFFSELKQSFFYWSNKAKIAFKMRAICVGNYTNRSLGLLNGMPETGKEWASIYLFWFPKWFVSLSSRLSVQSRPDSIVHEFKFAHLQILLIVPNTLRWIKWNSIWFRGINENNVSAYAVK